MIFHAVAGRDASPRRVRWLEWEASQHKAGLPSPATFQFRSCCNLQCFGSQPVSWEGRGYLVTQSFLLPWQGIEREGDSGGWCFLLFPRGILEESQGASFALCVWVPKLLVEAFNPGKNSVVTQNPIAVPKKKWFGEEMRHFFLRKQTKAAQLKLAAHSKAREEQYRVWMAVHHPSPSWDSHPASTSPSTCTHSIPVPASLLWPGPPKLPKILWALYRGRVVGPCWGGGGTCCILAFFWELSDCFGRKIESLSWNTPGVSHEPWVERRKQLF